MKYTRRLALASSIATLLAAPVASAEVYSWQTGGATNIWSTGAGDTNWFLGANTVLSPWANGNDAVFTGTGEAITLSGTLAPTSTTVGTGNGTWSFIGSGVLGGTLVKEGTGTLTFGTGTGTNAYTGVNTLTGTTINGGTISIGSGGTAGATSNVNALGSGPVTINTGGTLKLWIQNNNTTPWTFANNLSINGGTVLGEDGINAISGTVEVGTGGATLSSKWSGKTLSFTNVISGSGPVTVQRASTTSGSTDAAVIMTGKNTYTGGTTINSGILQLGNSVTTDAGSVGILRGDVTVNSTATLRLSTINALGYGAGTKVNTLNVNGGTVVHDANGDNGWGVTYNLTGGTMRSTSATGRFAFGGGTSVNTLAAAGSSVIDGNIILREGNPTPQVVFTTADGAAVNDLVINAAISDNNGFRGIQKEGAGTMVLNGNSTYTGATLVNAGTLVLGGAGQLSSSAITVKGGATFRVDSAGKFLSELTVNDGATLGLVAKTGETTTVSNMLMLPEGGTFSIVPSFAGRPQAGQTIDLLSSSFIMGTSTITPVLNSFGATRVTGTAAVNTSGTAVQLTITTGAADLVWNNAAGNSTWDLNTSANFNNGGVNDSFFAADAVTFNDSVGTGDKTVTLSGGLAPSQITVNNSNGNYTFGGTGSLVGAGSLVKSGTGTVTLGSTMTYGMTGAIRVNDGTLNLGNKTVTINAPLTMAGGTLTAGTLNASAFQLEAGTVSATVTGSGALTKSTGGTAILTANNSYTGLTTVNAGTLQFGAKGGTGAPGAGGIFIDAAGTVKFDRDNNYGNVTNNFMGSGALIFDGVTTSNQTQYFLTGDNSGFSGTITALDGRVGATNAAGNRFGNGELIAVGKATSSGQFWLTGGNFANNFTISGEGWLEAQGRLGAIRFGGGTISGNVTLAGNARINAHASTGAISGAITDNGQNFGVEFGGSSAAGTITLSGASTYTGATTVNNATVILNGSLGNTAVTLADANGTIGGKGTIGGSLTFGTSAGGAKLIADASTAGALDVEGALSVVGATPVGVTLTTGSSMTMGSPYTVLTYGTTTATGANFALANQTNFRQGVFAVADGKVTVDVGSKAIAWTGAGGANWDVNTTASWVDNQTAVEKFYQGDAVSFGNTGAGTLTLAAGLTPASVTVDSSSDYTFNAGTITSPGALTKSGSGTLLLNTQNTFLGGAVINGGTLAVDGNNGTTRLQNNAQVTVNTGSTFEIRGTNALPAQANAVDVVVNQGATLRVVSGASVASPGSHAHVRTLTLNGATVDLSYSGTGGAYNNESLQIGTGGLTVSGTTPSSVILSGGATSVQAGISLDGSRTFTVNDVTGNGAVDFLVGAELENTDTNNGALIKEGAGTMHLTADTSYTGTTSVNAGTLLVSAGLNGTTGVSVAPGAALGGNGTLAPGGSGVVSIISGGIIAPGVGGIGTLTLNSANTNAFGALFLDSGAKLTFELGTGLQSDKISLVNGAIGDVSFFNNTIDFSDLSSGTLAQGSYTLFSSDIQDAYFGLTIDSAGFISGGLAIGSGLEAYAGSSLQVVGNDIVLNVVPEPVTFASLAGGVAMLLGMRRRRR